MNPLRTASAVAFFILTIWIGAPCALAQTAATGALSGVIADPTGAVIVNAQIKVTNEATGETRTVSSRADGAYVVPLLPPGAYRVEVASSGFKTSLRSGVRINVTETATLDIRVEVGAAQETIVVEASPSLAQTESSSLGRVVNEKVVVNLPLVTRNFTQIIGLSPGIQTSVTNAAELGRGTGGLGGGTAGPGIYVHGGRPSDNNFEMNGVQINDLQGSGNESGGVAIPNPDTIEQFKVQTGQYDASFGRNAGANVNLVTKSGSNEFHGTLFEFFRNDALNANDFFFNLAGQKKPVLKQNQFGFTLGGPVKKDKLLFFGSFQGTRQINGVAGVGRTKSRATIFSPPLTDDRSAAAIGGLFAGQRGALGGTAILADGSNINPVALRLLQMKLPNGSYLIPTPQVINRSRPFNQQGVTSLSIPSTFDEEQFMSNLDYLHTARSKFAGRFFSASGDEAVSLPGGNVPGFPRQTESEFRNFSLTHTYVLSQSLFNEARLGFHRTRITSRQETAFKYSDIGVRAAEQVNEVPDIRITGSYQLATVFPIQLAQNTFSAQDSVSYLRGRHSMRFGGNLSYSQDNFGKFVNQGILIFLSFPDFLLGLDGRSNGTGVFSNVFGSVDYIGLPDRAFRLWEGSLYFQDDLKLTPRLTLNLGVRYERIGHIADASGRNAGFNAALADPNPPATGSRAGFVVPSNYSGGAIPPGVAQLDNHFGINGEGQNNWAPRIGFAWQVLPQTGRLTLRGGYGIYYTRTHGQPFIRLAFTPPFAQLRISTGVPNALASFANPFPQPIPPLSSFPFFPSYSPTTALNLATLAPDYRPPITQQYSLNLQTEIAKDFLLEVGYVGTRGTHLIRARSLNQASLASSSRPIRGVTTNTVANIAQRVPFLGFIPTGIHQTETAGESRYNGLEVSLTKRLSKGLSLLASYTWSKSLDTDGASIAGVNAGNLTIGDQNNPRDRYGPSDFNRAHRLVLSYVYELPFFANRGGLTGKLLGGWAVAGVTVFQSGLPLTIFGANGNNLFGITDNRAQLAQGCTHNQVVTPGSVTDKMNNYFNRTCFTSFPVIGDDGRGTGFGNSGVGIVRGPDQRNFDLAVIKRTRMGWPTEISNLEFRAEFFNAFNTPQFANPAASFTAATFGQITSTSVSPRIMQLALKLNF